MTRNQLAAAAALLLALQGCSTSTAAEPPPQGGPGGPELLAPGVLSTRMGEYSPTFDPERQELVFMRRTPGRFDYTLYRSRLVDGAWSEPESLPFSGSWRDGGPSFVPGGDALLFDSRRPAEGLEPESINVWRVERSDAPGANGWGAPALLRAVSVNPPSDDGDQADEFGPFEDARGNLYVYSFRVPDRGGRHYVLERGADEVRHESELPDPSANTFVGYASLSPDGNLAVVEGRARGRNDTDLFLYRKDVRGRWGGAIELPSVNTRWGEGTPSITADGRSLLFSSSRTTGDERAAFSNLYRIDLAVLLEADGAQQR